jgi:polygalacturonase
LTQDQFSVLGNGNADERAAIQAAIDRVQETTGVSEAVMAETDLLSL